MPTPATPAGFLSFTLHAHLPYVINHGTWPHGMEWLHEAAAETYLPLLRVLANLDRDNISLCCNLVLTPILLEQLSHPVFLAEFPKYLTRKIIAAREDEAFFVQSGEAHYAETARFWHRFFTDTLDHFNTLNGDLIAAFRRFAEAGRIDILTCAATHGFLPLLGTDESVRAQVRTGVATHQRHLGTHPHGIWSPECGYRPAGPWRFPVAEGDNPDLSRIGVEQAFAESSLDFFYVDTHLVAKTQQTSSPYRTASEPETLQPTPTSLYQPWTVASHHAADSPALPPVAIFARDPRTGLQVWSGDHGYPGDATYLDFHKKRWPGGHRYWRVTGVHVDMADKQPWYPQDAEARTRVHAAHFVSLVADALAPAMRGPNPPILCAPFDAELFGHWWFEGPLWLEAVAREVHHHPARIALTTSATYLRHFPPADTITLPEGSWGTGGRNNVWMNADTAWTWSVIYPAELYIRELATAARWQDSPLNTRVARQLCRELLLLESSDWQFLITTGAARDYAELRFHTHTDQFNDLKSLWETLQSTATLNPDQEKRLAEIELRDSIFPDIDPSLWAAHATPPTHR